MRVLIIGGGLGGLCLANGLCKSDIEILVFEKQLSPEEGLSGYGIHINGPGRIALQSCLPRAQWEHFQKLSTTAGTKMFFRDESLGLLAERDDALLNGKASDKIERRGIGRIELRDILLDGLSASDKNIIQWDREFARYEHQDDCSIRVHFTGGSFVDGDLLVGADGCRSKVREQRLPSVNRVDLGINAIAGRYMPGHDELPRLPKAFTDGSLNNIVPAGKGWMFVSSWEAQQDQSARNNDQKRQKSVVWAYVVPKSGTNDSLRQLSAGQLLASAKDGTQKWSPKVAHIIENTEPETVTRIDLRSAPHLGHWKADNVTLIGDSIHSMTPMADVGANTALRDAELLTKVLSKCVQRDQSMEDAISFYEHRMREYANAAVALSRRNAESASSTGLLQRHALRTVLRAAQASEFIMRRTIGKAAVEGA
ncbi:FAD/NAD(P)-binding domain-containing protein [Diaporthe amygdali]|uniref:FAD/NAD(P)-binding domain-containing protein n=1 Tax=Phomopsis amygdali TaxID=1214568 RepID=UPI0022FE787F|nr:FAD/NAD(P)-binding domain-containing protein [Diaporthe amygdali]KAJ0107189.1 FAD/NAD(P)-binding domain-containing protein [Diaporthe amygdali]